MKRLTLTILGWAISIVLIVGLAMRLNWGTIWTSLLRANVYAHQ